MEPKTMGERIVSKSAYIEVQGKRVGLACSAVLCGLMLIQFSTNALYAAYDFFYCLRYTLYLNGAFSAVVSSVLTFCFYKGMKASSRKFAKVGNVVPLTRANTADLPAPESLVRASEEPVMEQQNVLLRAASERQERHEEQLVRAAAGGQEQRP